MKLSLKAVLCIVAIIAAAMPTIKIGYKNPVLLAIVIALGFCYGLFFEIPKLLAKRTKK